MASAQSAIKSFQNTHQQGEQNVATRNVGQTERWLSGVIGGMLATYGIFRRDWLGAGLAIVGGALFYRGTSGHSFLYQRMNISTAERQPNFAPGIPKTVSSIPGKRGVRVQRSMTVSRSAEDLFNYWYDIEQAPRYMDYIQSVMKTGERTSHWVAQGPKNKTIEWNAEFLQVIPNKSISWHVHGKPTTANAGKVSFDPAPDGHGTVVTLELDFLQFQGAFGMGIGTIIGHIPEQQALETLRHFKEIMETGEVPTIKGQPTGEGHK
ncbi:MAG: SRPBCC family protein [Ktedonobacteraceae bacterium]